jgi:hypothetical protein
VEKFLLKVLCRVKEQYSKSYLRDASLSLLVYHNSEVN